MKIRVMAAATGFLGMALGAFGAHALKHVLNANGTVAIWQTAVLYHLVHAVAALWASENRPAVAVTWLTGVWIFSGSLYVLALSNVKWLGAVTPVGGLCLLAGWLLVALPPRKSGPPPA